MTVTYTQLEYTQFITYDFAFIIQVTPNKHFEYTQGAPSRRRVTGVVRHTAVPTAPGPAQERFDSNTSCILEWAMKQAQPVLL